MGVIDSTAKVHNSSIANNACIYKNVDLRECTIEDKVIIGDNCKIEKSKLGFQTQVYPNGIMYSTTVGDYSYIQKNSAVWHASIGKYCSISWNVSIGGGEHDFHKVTSHSFLYATAYGFVDEPLYEHFTNTCEIENDVWIGAGASILRGVKVGNGAVIGAGSIVTKDVEPYSIVAGVPAKKIGQRCDDELIDAMLEIKWWDFPVDVIKENVSLFNAELTRTTIEKLRELRLKSNVK